MEFPQTLELSKASTHGSLWQYPHCDCGAGVPPAGIKRAVSQIPDPLQARGPHHKKTLEMLCGLSSLLLRRQIEPGPQLARGVNGDQWAWAELETQRFIGWRSEPHQLRIQPMPMEFSWQKIERFFYGAFKFRQEQFTNSQKFLQRAALAGCFRRYCPLSHLHRAKPKDQYR